MNWIGLHQNIRRALHLPSLPPNASSDPGVNALSLNFITDYILLLPYYLWWQGYYLHCLAVSQISHYHLQLQLVSEIPIQSIVSVFSLNCGVLATLLSFLKGEMVVVGPLKGGGHPSSLTTCQSDWDQRVVISLPWCGGRQGWSIL